MASTEKAQEFKLIVRSRARKSLLQCPTLNLCNLSPLAYHKSTPASRDRRFKTPPHYSRSLNSHRRLKIATTNCLEDALPLKNKPKEPCFTNTFLNSRLNRLNLGFYSSRNQTRNSTCMNTKNFKRRMSKDNICGYQKNEKEKIIEEHMKLGTINNPYVCLMGIQQKFLQRKLPETTQDSSATDKVSLRILLSDKINVTTLVSTIRKMRRSTVETIERGNRKSLARLARMDKQILQVMPRHLVVPKKDACT